MWDWKDKRGGDILQQTQRLGASVDWSRTVFTLDDKVRQDRERAPGTKPCDPPPSLHRSAACQQFSRAVQEAFVRLYDRGLVYRDTRCIHWSCALQSAISDIEVERQRKRGN